MTEEMYEIISQSWEQNPKERISTETIIHRLDELFIEMKKDNC